MIHHRCVNCRYHMPVPQSLAGRSESCPQCGAINNIPDIVDRSVSSQQRDNPRYTGAEELFRKEYVSYSRLRSYEQCPRRFKMEYLDGIPARIGPAGQMGTLVHAVLASYLNEVMRAHVQVRTDVGDILPRIRPIHKHLRRRHEIRQRLDEREASRLLSRFAEIMPEIDGSAIAAVEAEREFDIGRYRCKAVLDLVLRDNDGHFAIIDFKTGKARYANDFQLGFYTLAMLQAADVGYGGFIFLRRGEGPSYQQVRLPIEACGLRSFNKTSVRRVEQRILRTVETIEADRAFKAKKGPLCNYCGVRKHCSAYRKPRRRHYGKRDYYRL